VRIVKKESPDWSSPATQKELLGSAATVDLEDEDLDKGRGRITFALALRAVWGSKKDLLNVLATAGMVALAVVKLVEELRSRPRIDGSGWTVVVVTAWVSFVPSYESDLPTDRSFTGMDSPPRHLEILHLILSSTSRPHVSYPPSP